MAPLITQTSMDGSVAIFSPCMRYRYSLRRRWANGPRLGFMMLNPSTADAFQDDPTVRKCIGFAKRLNFGAIEVLNLWAIRSTDPAGVLAVDDPIGADNNRLIRESKERNLETIAAWGAHATGMLKRIGPARIRDVLAILRATPHLVSCLGRSADGSPRHPLMLPYSSQISVYGGV